MRTLCLLLSICCFYNVRLSAQSPDAASKDSIAYFCSICNNDCDTIAYSKPGTCPHCGMTLVQQKIAERRELMKKQHQQMTICFYLQEGVEVLDFAGPMEVFTAAGFRVFTVSRSKGLVTSQGILKIMPDYTIDDAPPSDILAFFGGGTNAATKDTALIAWIESRRASTSYFFSVCTGAFILGKAGLLDGLSATTFHSSIEALRTALPQTRVLANVRFVDNGRVMTTAGISAGIDGALHLVTRLKGEDAAKDAAAYMEYDRWIPNQGLVVDSNK
jgi:transcriptional regulator GlxA family with amidase domain/DNA-directed RNA polymerase subunit RPC12/RpoP